MPHILHSEFKFFLFCIILGKVLKLIAFSKLTKTVNYLKHSFSPRFLFLLHGVINMSVKVAVRVRPYNARENDMGAELCIKMVKPN
jgi:hypothetical protein